MKKLIIAANLGRIRVLKYREAGLDPIDHEHLLDEPTESGKEHVLSVQEWVTDKAGRFSQGNAAGVEGGMSYGEEHELKDEIERNAMRRVAARIGEIVREEDHPIWVLAAPRSILPRLESMLPVDARQSLEYTVSSDLTRCPLPEMEERFL